MNESKMTDYKGGIRLSRSFYRRDVLKVAPELLGKILVVQNKDSITRRFMITETEAYRGMEDLACHANKGKTTRTRIMFETGGVLYVYFVYGMYWMLNIVAGESENPQAALIRGIEGFNGPGKLTKALGIDRSYYGEDLTSSERIWIEDIAHDTIFKSGPRIGIDYAGTLWKNKPWRFYI